MGGPENLSELGIARGRTRMSMPEEAGCSGREWFFTRQEIESQTPSRKDGISLKKEGQLRRSYSLFLENIGEKIKAPHLTIATAMMLCHRFYMRQSHAKNDWQTIAAACVFLACKMDKVDTPDFPDDVVLVAYEIAHKSNPTALQRIKKSKFVNKQMELIKEAERVLLTTIDFDLDIELPHKTLVTVLKRLNIPNITEFTELAWYLVDQWLQTSLCMQYKPHYIAAGSIDLAARLLKVKLPTDKGRVWWSEIDVAPKQLDEVTERMQSRLAPLPSKERNNHATMKGALPPSQAHDSDPEI